MMNTLILGSRSMEDDRHLLIKGEFKKSSFGRNTVILNLEDNGFVNYIAKLDNKSSETINGKASLKKIFNGFSLTGDLNTNFTIDIKYMIPIYFVRAYKKQLLIYKSVQFYNSEIIFLNVDLNKVFKLSSTNLYKLCKLNSEKNKIALSNQDAYLKKYRSDIEIEYKFNLDSNCHIWTLAIQFQKLIRQGELHGFMLQYLDNFNQWDFENYLYEITQPKKYVGYISFIKCPDEKFVVKQKIYAEDKLERIEIRNKNIELEKNKEYYLNKNYPELKYEKLEPFNRQRFDVNLESLGTGNIYSIMFDRNVVMNHPDHILVQCEIEYLKSRTSGEIIKVKEELSHVKDFVKKVFDKENIVYKETFYSKLSFLRDVNYKLNKKDDRK